MSPYPQEALYVEIPQRTKRALVAYAKRNRITQALATRILLDDALGVGEPPCPDDCANLQPSMDRQKMACMKCGRVYPRLAV
jgi:hypothetical protein